MLGRRRAGTTGTRRRRPCPRGLGRRGRPRTASPLWGSARTRAARSASKDTALRVGASGQRPCLSRPQALSRSRPRYCLDSITNTPRGQSPGGQGWPGCHGRPGRAGPPIPAAPAGRAGGRCAAPRPPPAAQATASGLGLNRSPQPAAMAASAPTTRPSRSTSRRPRTPPPTPTVVAIRQARVRVHAAHPAARNRRHLPPGRRRPGGRRWLVPAPPPPGPCRCEATAASC
jgi:hypothetical protein